MARSWNLGEFLRNALPIQKRSLSETKLTIEKAVTIAISSEMAESQVKTFQPESGINKIQEVN